MNEQEFRELKTKLDLFGFRHVLMLHGSPLDRALCIYGISKDQYIKITELMDEYRSKIENDEPYSQREFENQIYEIVPFQKGNYHMCEVLARGFRNEGCWEDVYEKLYG